MFGPDAIEGVPPQGMAFRQGRVVELPGVLHAESFHHVQRTPVSDVGERDEFRDAEFRGVRDAGPGGFGGVSLSPGVAAQAPADFDLPL